MEARAGVAEGLPQAVSYESPRLFSGFSITELFFLLDIETPKQHRVETDVDRQNNSVGFNIAWSWKGISAKIRSRILSAADGLGAQRIDESGLEGERRISVHRAVTGSTLLLVDAATKSLSKEMENDSRLAGRFLEILSRDERKAQNIEGAFALALEDLRNGENQPDDSSGPDEIDPDIIARWQHYAEGATSEKLREKWGRVLASEIRKPGTFSPKVLRIIDELETETALLFEEVCRLRIDGWIPSISLERNNKDITLLEEAGLVVKSEIPSSIAFGSTTRGDGTAWWMHHNNQYGVADLPLNCHPAAIRAVAVSVTP